QLTSLEETLDPSIQPTEALCLLLHQCLRHVDLPRPPIAQPQPQQIPSHSLRPTPVDLSIQPVPVRLVSDPRRANLEHRIPPGPMSSRYDPIEVRCHHDVKRVADLKRGEVLRLNRDQWLGDQCLQPALSRLVASPERLIGEQESAVLKVAA